MSIQNYLNKIKDAVFGKDIREAIYASIKQCYDDAAVNHDNANMEVKFARGSHNTLNDRLTEHEKNQKEINEQLDTKANNLQGQINNLVFHSGDSNPEVSQARVNNEGVIYPTLKGNIENIESNKLKDLELQGFTGNNKIDDTFIKGVTFNGNFTFLVNDSQSLKIGKKYRLRIWFSNGTSVSSKNAIWQFNYIDGSNSSFVSIGVDIVVIKKVKSITIQFVDTSNSDYNGLVYDKIMLSDGDFGDIAYESYSRTYKSNKLKKLERNLLNKEEFLEATLNLFDPNDSEIMFGKQLQPFNIVEDDKINVSGYIPIEKGDILYFYPGTGNQVSHICDGNKKKITYQVLNTNPTTGNVIDVENAKYIRFNIPKDKFNSDFVVTKNRRVLKKMPFNVIRENLLYNIFNNTNINWWYGKKGDSLGDSLTGQGFFQKYVSMYYNLDSVTIGEISKTNMDTNTYVGAYNTIIDKIYKKYNGNITIILCTPFYVPSEGDDGERFVKLDKAVKEIGQLHGLPVADFGGMSGANKYTKDIYWTPADRTHPIEDFYRDKVAPILIETMDKIKPIDFARVNSIEYSVTQ